MSVCVNLLCACVSATLKSSARFRPPAWNSRLGVPTATRLLGGQQPGSLSGTKTTVVLGSRRPLLGRTHNENWVKHPTRAMDLRRIMVLMNPVLRHETVLAGSPNQYAPTLRAKVVCLVWLRQATRMTPEFRLST